MHRTLLRGDPPVDSTGKIEKRKKQNEKINHPGQLPLWVEDALLLTLMGKQKATGQRRAVWRKMPT